MGEQGSDLTSSFLCSAPAWQASPSAACRAWETTWRMQASGVCCPWAASISSSRALHTEGDTSSGSTKRNTLRAEVGGPWAAKSDGTEVWAEACEGEMMQRLLLAPARGLSCCRGRLQDSP